MEPLLYGLLGRTLGHSVSPQIHAAFGCADYGLLEREPEQLAELLSQENVGGLNVTIPYKQTVISHCAMLSHDAKRIGAVNTLVRREKGLYGHNTDLYGFQWMLQRAGIDMAGKKVVVLGSGGTSHTVCTAACDAGAREVVVVSRTGVHNYDNLSQHRDAEVLVNTTPVGMYPHTDHAPVSLWAFPQLVGVADVVYNPCRTRLTLEAAKMGIPHTNGLPMLVAQAKAAEELFFGVQIPNSTLETVLCDISLHMENIVLVGMPGCGKSTVGEILAKLSGKTLVDLDAEIIKTAGKFIPDIFAQDGESIFRSLERDAVCRFGKEHGQVIVTGGGAVLDSRNWAPLRQNGRIVHLTRSLELLATEGRPLSEKGDVQTLYAERLPCYEGFRDVEIANDGSAEETAALIWRDFCEAVGDKRP